MARLRSLFVFLWLCCASYISAIEVDWGNQASVKSAASTIASGMLSYYHGTEYGQTPGVLPGPYYWWEAGAMFGSLVDYYHTTGDDSYNPAVIQAMQFQVGPHNDYMPPNESASLGNDDQAFWAMAALRAAETNFPNPPNAKDPSWLSLAQAVFNEQIGRWDTTTCGGGIRWQIYQISGYDVKNTISNGCLFNIAARLARYTGDQMYADWAIKIWDWMEMIGFIDSTFSVYDNAEAARDNCSHIVKNQWTYNAGTVLMGASALWNFTGDPVWRNRTDNLLSTIIFDFFPDGVMKEICEANNVCNVDEHSFKAYLSRWMAASSQMAPWISTNVSTVLLSSAKAAVAQCTGTFGVMQGTACGLKWTDNGTWDGSNGVGQQMAALEVVLATLVGVTKVPVTLNSGGNSTSNPTAGHNASTVEPGATVTDATEGDKAGAWILTVIMVVFISVCWWFLSTEAFEGRGGAATMAGGKRGNHRWRFSEKGKQRADMAAGDSTLSFSRHPMEIERENTYIMARDTERRSRLSLGSTLDISDTPTPWVYTRNSSVPSLAPIGEQYRKMERMPDRSSVPIFRGGDLPV